MNVSILAAGAAGMYCGSCMRDNALAAALMRMGHQVSLIPLYTPLRTEPQSVAHDEVFFGGVNVYLQHASGVFRKTPRALDWLLDRAWLLKLAGSYGADTPPEQLVGLTLAILQGEEGPAVKELRRLLAFLKETAKPQVVSPLRSSAGVDTPQRPTKLSTPGRSSSQSNRRGVFWNSFEACWR